MSQSQPLRIENPDLGSFTTARTQNQKLWFVNNRAFENQCLAYLAKYQEKQGVTLYAKVFQGNHYHIVSKFPNCNRATFYRDYNARMAESARRHIDQFEGGTLLERRYSEQALPLDEDIEERFFYAALQPVAAGLCEKIGDYPSYNSFDDAVSERVRHFKLVDWATYNEAKRNGKRPKISDHTKTYSLKFSRLPGYENLSSASYKKLMYQKLEARRLDIVRAYKAKGHSFMTKHELRKTMTGSRPKNIKKSNRNSRRPLVLTSCINARKQFHDWYFAIYNSYKQAVKMYLSGDYSTVFPPGTYKPPGPLIPFAA